MQMKYSVGDQRAGERFED